MPPTKKHGGNACVFHLYVVEKPKKTTAITYFVFLVILIN